MGVGGGQRAVCCVKHGSIQRLPHPSGLGRMSPTSRRVPRMLLSGGMLRVWGAAWDPPTPGVGGPRGMQRCGQDAGPWGWLHHSGQGCTWKGPVATCTSRGNHPNPPSRRKPRWWVASTINFGVQGGGTLKLEDAANPHDKKDAGVHYLHITDPRPTPRQ